MASTCPVCGAAMAGEKGKMNVPVEVCGLSHGAYLPTERLQELVDAATMGRISNRASTGGAGATCPGCSTATHEIDLGGLRADACTDCGGLWFPGDDLTRYQREWRSRAYGENSFVSRHDVLGETGKLYAAEVIAGVLTEFELSLEEEPA